MQTFAQADFQQEYWKSKSMEERLHAAMELTKIAYQVVDTGFLPMDKTAFSMKKRNGLYIS